MTQPVRQPAPLTDAEIARVVAAFYAEVRRHPVLGPVFAAHVPAGGWPAHEAKIAAFWRRAILKVPDYDGNPMAVHLGAMDVQAGHFAHWLALFETVISREIGSEVGAAWVGMAQRIGRGMRLAIEDRDRPQGAVPRLI